MTKVRITTRAEADLRDIYLFTIQRFGRPQAVRYLAALYSAFDFLAESPEAGRRALVLGEQVRRHEHASHVVFYEPFADGILVLAVVHARSIRKIRF